MQQLDPRLTQLHPLNVDTYADQDHAGFEIVYKNPNLLTMKHTRRTFLRNTSLLAAALPLANLKVAAGERSLAAPTPAAPASGLRRELPFSPGNIAGRKNPSLKARKPIITGSFIDVQHVNNWDAQYWVDECRDWHDENWEAIVADMKAMGLDTVILTNCALWGRPLYPANPRTVGRQLPMPCQDPVGAIVRAADKNGMSIYLGLGAFGRYSINANPDLSPEHDTWLGNMAEDLLENYGRFKAMKGFYITSEAHGIKEGGLFAQDDCDKTARFVKSIRERVKETKIMMSPANLKKPRPEQLDPLLRQLDQLNVDIFAYQDHAGFEKAYKNLNFYEAAEGYNLIKPLHEKLGQQMWVNCEVFEYTEKRPDGRRICTPCQFERLERQLLAAAPTADKLIIYQYQGLMNKRSDKVNIGAPGTDELHDAYVRFRAQYL